MTAMLGGKGRHFQRAGKSIPAFGLRPRNREDKCKAAQSVARMNSAVSVQPSRAQNAVFRR